MPTEYYKKKSKKDRYQNLSEDEKINKKRKYDHEQYKKIPEEKNIKGVSMKGTL